MRADGYDVRFAVDHDMVSDTEGKITKDYEQIE